jgi:hypothetical protein
VGEGSLVCTMPLEVISTTYLYQQQLSSSSRKLLKGKAGKEDKTDELSRLKNESSTLANVCSNLNNTSSRIDDANNNLMSALQDVQDIKVYRINKEEFASSLAAPSVTFTQNTPQLPTDNAFMIPKPSNNPLLKKNNYSKGGRKLVGHQMLKQIQVKADLIAEMERLKNESVSNDPAIKQIIASNVEIDTTDRECRFLSHKGKLHYQKNFRKLENVNMLSKTRRDLIQQSENRRKDIQIYPDHFNTLHCKERNDEESVNWSLDSCQYYRKNVHDDLFGIKTNQEESIFSSSSSEDEGDKVRNDKRPKNGKHQPSLPVTENKRSQASFHSPRLQKFRERVPHSSLSGQHRNGAVGSNNSLVSSTADSSRLAGSSDGASVQNGHSIDISVKLKNSLDQMDQSLYRDLIRQQKIAQTKRDRTLQRSLATSLAQEPVRLKDTSPSSKSHSRINSRKNSGAVVTAVVPLAVFEEKSTDITKIKVLEKMKNVIPEEEQNSVSLYKDKIGDNTQNIQEELEPDSHDPHVDSDEKEDVFESDLLITSEDEVVALNEEQKSFVQNYSHRLRSFYQSIPNNPRGTIIFNKTNVPDELKQQVLQEKQRKMDIADGIINEILQQRQSRWDRQFAAYVQKESKKEEEIENVRSVKLDEDEEVVKESSKIYFVSPIGTVLR